MYAFIGGILEAAAPGRVEIDCGGVGYSLSVSDSTLSRMPKVGEPARLYAHLSVREDALELYGFYEREEKRLFEMLISVSGIGPKSALSALSVMSAGSLALAIASGDADAIARAQGIGKKTAQRLILELRDKVEEASFPGAPYAAPLGESTREAVEALMALGYPASEAARAIASLSPMPEGTDEMVFLALKGMGK